MRRRGAWWTRLGALVLLVLSAPVAFAAPTLFLSDSTFDDNLTRVFAVDPATGAMTLVANLGTIWTPSLAMAAADGHTLYLTGSDNSGAGACGTGRSCILLRVVFDPASSSTSVDVIGPVVSPTGTVVEIVGLTFDRDGRLFASSQQDSGIYLVDPATAQATLVGTSGVEIHGGDITTDDQDRMWLWTNLGASTGRYLVNPFTAAATSFDLHPGLDFAGMAALGHGPLLYGASPLDDKLYESDASTGFTGNAPALNYLGAPFDHKRGDMDSPWCEGDLACDDADACTVDTCSPGGCQYADTRFADADGDGVADCADACPVTAGGDPVDGAGCSIADRCPCSGPGRPWANHGEYVSCVDAASQEILGTGQDHGRAVSAAAQSGCGKPRWSEFKSKPHRTPRHTMERAY